MNFIYITTIFVFFSKTTKPSVISYKQWCR